MNGVRQYCIVICKSFFSTITIRIQRLLRVMLQFLNLGRMIIFSDTDADFPILKKTEL